MELFSEIPLSFLLQAYLSLHLFQILVAGARCLSIGGGFHLPALPATTLPSVRDQVKDLYDARSQRSTFGGTLLVHIMQAFLLAFVAQRSLLIYALAAFFRFDSI
jgi:hypothetical protein